MKPILESDQIFIQESSRPGPETDVFFLRSAQGDMVQVNNDLSAQPAGIRSWSAHIGVCANGTPDFTLISLEQPGTCSAVFTRSLTCSDSVRFGRVNVQQGLIQSLCVISKNANVFTPSSAADIQTIAAALSDELGIPPEQQLISCTGVIGVPLPMDVITTAIKGVGTKLQPGGLESSAKAILTTDRQEKTASMEVAGTKLCGFVKGAGMIEPNMATMLGYFFTDAAIDKVSLDKMLKRAVDKSFNMLSVDADCSTSDTVAILSTGTTPLPEQHLEDFERGLTALCIKLARDIAGQAEGAHRVIEAEVSLSTSQEDAKHFAKKIINSPLIKTAVYGCDPNWGRIVMAIGKPSDRNTLREIDPQELSINILGQTVFHRGQSIPLDLEQLTEAMRVAKNVPIQVTIGSPVYTAKAWGCDLSEDYIKINAEYTT